MENNEMMPTNNNINQELIEILNTPEILSSFNNVFQKHRILANRTIRVEFKFDEKEDLQIDDEEGLQTNVNRRKFTQFELTWCPSPPCPPPGRWST